MGKVKKLISLLIIIATFLAVVPVVEAEDTTIEIGGVYYLGSEVTGCRDDAVSINILSEVNGIAITKIKDKAFDGKTSLKSVMVAEGIVTVGGYVFAGCSSLESISLPDTVTSILAGAFTRCTSLKEIIIPKKVTNSKLNYYDFGHWFEGCSSLEKVTFAEGATVIPRNAFIDCKEVEILLPETVTSIKEYAFSGLDWLINLDFLPESVQEIETCAFENCTNLKSAVMPQSLDHTVRYAFANCTSLTEVVFPDNFRILGGFGFSGCTSLKEIVLPKGIRGSDGGGGVGNKGKWFSGCSSLEKVTFAEGAEIIPDSAFEGCKEVEIVLPDTIKNIDDCAFYGLPWLKNIDFLPEGLQTIGRSAFESCENLTSIILPETVTMIRPYAFRNCTSLEEITIPKNVVRTAGEREYDVSGNWFNGCTSLKNIYFQDGMTNIPGTCLSGTPTDFNVYIPDTVKTISANVFAGCENLSSVTLPPLLEEIGKLAFYRCKSLSSIYIPQTVKSIADNAFADCSDIFTVYCGANKAAAEAAAVADLYHDFSGTWSYGTLSPSRTYFYTDTSTQLTGGYISLVAKYAIRPVDDGVVSGINMSFVIPKDCRYIEGSAYIDTTPVTAVSISGNILTMKNLPGNGTASIRLIKEGARDVISRAQINYWNSKSGARTETIGTICEQVRTVSIRTAPYTNDGTVVLSGVATPLTNVDLYVDGEYVATVTSNKAGTYTAEIKIENPSQGNDYVIKAVIDGNEEEAKETTVKYKADMPILKGFKLYMNNHINPGEFIDLMIPGRIPTAEFWPVKNYVFKAEFTNPELIDEVYITSIKGGTRKTINAIYNEKTGLFETKQIFDPMNINYVPGDIELSFTLKEADTEEMLSKFIEADYSSVADDWSFELLEKYETAEEVKYTGYLNQKSDTTGVNRCDVTYHAWKDETFDTTAALNNGYTRYGNIIYMKEVTQNMFKAISYDMESGYFVQAMIRGGHPKFQGFAKAFCQVVDEVCTVWGFWDQSMAYTDQLNMIQNSNHPNKAQMEMDLKYNYILLTATTMLGLTFNILAGISCVTMPGMAIVVGLVNIGAGMLIESILKDMGIAPTSNIYRFLLNWLIDPSGYVYEGVTSNRLQGAKVTVYYKDPETGETVVWDAENYDQLNPLITNAEGRYSWIVPEGQWQVKCELEGYDTVITDWLPVPPPQMDVNIGMVSKAVPYAENISAAGNIVKINFSKYMKPETVENITVEDSEGNIKEYVITYPETETDAAGNILAREYRLELSDEIAEGDVININFSESIQSYAGVGMENKICPVTVAEAIPELKADELLEMCVYAGRRITVEANGYEDGEEIEVVSDLPDVISVEKISESVTDGVFYVKVKANDTGSARITFKAVSTGETVTTEVVALSAVNNQVVINDVTEGEKDTYVILENITGKNIFGKCIIAVYDGEKLTDIKIQDFETTRKDVTVTFEDYKINSENYKIMIFDTLTSVMPMAYTY